MIEVSNPPAPVLSNTLSDTMLVPGATPTTPRPLARAPIVPATWVPWPLPSVKGVSPLIQLRDQAVLIVRSPVVSSTPLSITKA